MTSSAVEVINIGAYPNDATGDPIREAFTKINYNFTLFSGTLNPFTPTVPGLVPASGGGTSTTLRADGTWTSIFTGSWTFPALNSTMVNAATGNITTVNANLVEASYVTATTGNIGTVNATTVQATTGNIAAVNATTVAASSQVTIAGVPAYDATTGNIGYIARTLAEVAASVIPTSYVYPSGIIDRYAPNTTPGTTDMSAAFTAANNVWLNGGAAIQLQSNSIYYVASALTLSAPIIFNSGAILKVNTVITLNGPPSTPAGVQKIFSLPTAGALVYTNVTTVGSGYVPGTYTGIALTGGSGTGAQATIVVSSGGTVSSVTMSANGIGYLIGDTVSATAASIGGTGSGFVATVRSVAQILGSLGNVDIYTRWYGDVADGNYDIGTGTDNTPAFCAAIGTAGLRATSFTTTPSLIRTLSGVYHCGEQICIGDNINWLGSGKYGTIVFTAGTFSNIAGLIAINGNGGYPTRFSGFAVFGQIGGSGGSGIVCTKNATFISDVWVAAFTAHPGIVLSSSDNFLFDFACELNGFGVQITSSDVTVENGTLYQNAVNAIVIDNTGGVGNTDSGRVTIVNVRDFGSVQAGFLVSGGQHVTLSACHVASNLNSNYNVAGFQIGSGTDVNLDGCTATIATGASTAPGFLLSSGDTDIVLSGCKAIGWYDGLQADSTLEFAATGCRFSGNTRNGILITAGGPVNLTGNQCNGNGAAGIDSENTAGSGYHNVTGNGCYANGTYGFILNCGAAAFTNFQGNQSINNATGTYHLTGTTANINGTATGGTNG